MAGTVSTGPIDRASAEDLVSLATDVGSAPMQVGAVLMLDTGDGFDGPVASATIGERIRAIPRLRQRLTSTPLGCGRPVWVDDPRFDLDEHLDVVQCPGPGDDGAVLAIAAEVIDTRLPPDRPLWRMRFVTGVDGDRTALVVAFHHVLADGIGGLAVLAGLVDGAPVDPVGDFPRPAPSTRELASDAIRTRRGALRELGGSVGRVREALVGLRPARTARAQRCSINRPTGPQRRFVVVRAELEDVVRLAHAHQATVNDVVLTAVGAALHRLLQSRGEIVDRFVISVPVSARRETSVAQLGNQVGVVPIEVPGTGDGVVRLRTIAEASRRAKTTAPAASTALLGPAFRLLARLGLFQWFIDRQRLVHTFVTNLRGPDTRLAFLGAPITDIVPVAVVTGNVSLSFAVLSYAGTLGITVIADPEVCPDLAVLRDALDEELHALIGSDPN